MTKKGDPETVIKECTSYEIPKEQEKHLAKHFNGYLFWCVKSSRIKNESSTITCWKLISMVYARLAEEHMKECVLYDIRSVPRHLSLSLCLDHTDSVIVDPAKADPLFGLGGSEKEKSGHFVEDLCTLQNGHSCAILRCMRTSDSGRSYRPSWTWLAAQLPG